MCIIQQISQGPVRGTAYATCNYVKSLFFLILKMNTTLFQILQIIQLKVISYLDTDHLPFLEKGKGGGWVS
jgi:hypothetical protein